jgi:hypothetical protein
MTNPIQLRKTKSDIEGDTVNDHPVVGIFGDIGWQRVGLRSGVQLQRSDVLAAEYRLGRRQEYFQSGAGADGKVVREDDFQSTTAVGAQADAALNAVAGSGPAHETSGTLISWN